MFVEATGLSLKIFSIKILASVSSHILLPLRQRRRHPGTIVLKHFSSPLTNKADCLSQVTFSGQHIFVGKTRACPCLLADIRKP
jgi:hypothetical protein